MQLEPSPNTPAVALSGGGLQLARTRRLEDVRDQDLAALVRRRWMLSRAQGWAVMSIFGLTFAAGMALATGAQGWMLGGFVAVVLSLAFGLGFMVEGWMWRAFLRLSRAYGLSDEACLQLYQRASQADAWVDVVRACGTEPTDEQIAAFVRPDLRAPVG